MMLRNSRSRDNSSGSQTRQCIIQMLRERIQLCNFHFFSYSFEKQTKKLLPTNLPVQRSNASRAYPALPFALHVWRVEKGCDGMLQWHPATPNAH
jgi:hypothetical protein